MLKNKRQQSDFNATDPNGNIGWMDSLFCCE